MAKKKYMVFGWTGPTKFSDLTPADELLGSSAELPEESPALSKDETEDGSQQFGLALVDHRVSLASNLMRGKDFMMKVYVNYSHVGGVEDGSAIVAYYEIPRSEA